MMLVIVAYSKMAAYERLTRAFAEEPTVRVMWDRRIAERRQQSEPHTPDRRRSHDRRTVQAFEGRDYIVVRTSNGPSQFVV